MAKETVTVEIKADSKQAVKEVDKVNESVKETKQSVDETTASTETLTNSLDNMTGGAVTKLKGLKAGVKGVTGGFKTLRTAIISTGLGALLVVIGSLIAAFRGSEEGQNKWNRIMSVTGALVGNLIDLLADLGDKIISVFENPQQALENFGNWLRQNIENRIMGMLELLPALGRAIQLVFEGEFTEAGEVALNAIGKVTLGVEDTVGAINDAIDATKEFAKEQIEEGKAAARVADMRAKADKIERNLLVERSKQEAKIAELRLKSRQEEEFSAEERGQALRDAQKLEDELLKKELEALQLRADAQSLENTFARSNKENLDEEARLIARVNQQQTARTNQQRQTQRELNRINREIERDNKAAALEQATFEKELREATAISEQEKRDLEILKEQEKYEELIMQAEQYGLDTEELEIAKEERLQQMRDEYAAKDKARDDKAKADKAKADKEEVDKQLALERAKENAKIAIVSQSARGLADIAQEGTDLQKALAITGVLADSVAAGIGIWRSSTSLPEPLATATRVANTIALAGATKKAISSITQIKAGSTSGTQSFAQNAGTVSSRTPSVNIVGAQQSNQSLNSINNNLGNPVRAYVVSGDVSTAQELDRKKVETATFGG
jgi:hypothetical protein